MKFLVAIDGSETSENAVYFASKLARESNSEITIIYVIPTIWGTKEDIIVLVKEEIGNPEKIGKKYLERALNIAKKNGVIADKKLLQGNPVKEILKEAEKGYDMIILGYHGKGKINELLMGSVASKVLRLSKLPVLFVR